MIGRLEDMSHVLVWTKTPLRQPNEPCTIDVVELPRLGLTFRAREVGRWQGGNRRRHGGVAYSGWSSRARRRTTTI